MTAIGWHCDGIATCRFISIVMMLIGKLQTLLLVISSIRGVFFHLSDHRLGECCTLPVHVLTHSMTEKFLQHC